MAHDVGTAPPVGRAADSGRSWVSWGAVFSGALIGAAVMTLLGLLWYAIAASGSRFISDNLHWFLGGTAILATFLAGLCAGWFIADRGPVIGAMHGLTEWGLITFAVVIVGPGLVTIFRSLAAAGALPSVASWLWASFWSVLIGLAAAVGGGAIGGTISSTITSPGAGPPVGTRQSFTPTDPAADPGRRATPG
jgi:hypothetical protein